MMDVRHEAVFRPGRLGTLTLPNRIVMGSMHLGVESAADAGKALAAFYAERARGPGLMITGGWAVNRVGSGGSDYGFVNEDAGLRALAAVTVAVHHAGGRIALQLFHAGRYAPLDSAGNPPVAPSAVPSRFAKSTPHPLDEREIWDTINDFAAAARNAQLVGFDAVEIMGAEGYLLNQFSSPLTNHRADGWGGDSSRRARFGIEVVRAVRLAVGDDFPVIFRLSGADLMVGSSTPAELVEYALRLAEERVDALNVAVGWHESAVPTVQAIVPAGVWVRYAAAIKSAVGTVPVIASNRINRIDLADRVLRVECVDFVSMARPFLADPHLMTKARTGRLDLVNVCIGCNQACIDRSLRGRRVSCLVNPRALRELEFGVVRRDPEERLRFAVVGGGPAGCEAARALAELGHEVDLFEAAAELGGQFRLARLVPGKADYGATIGYFEAELARLGVRVRLSFSVDAGNAASLGAYDGVVLATGTRPRELTVPDLGHPCVVDYPSAFSAGVRGERIAVIGGGGVALDLAHLLTHPADPADEQNRFLVEHGLLPGIIRQERSGPRVTLVGRGPRFGQRLGPTTRWALLDTIKRAGAELVPDARLEHLEATGVGILGSSGERRLIRADSVVVAVGQEPEDALVPVLARLGIACRAVGGARRAEGVDAVQAVEDGLHAAYELDELTRTSREQLA